MQSVVKSEHLHWVHTWAAMPQRMEPTILPPGPFTLRQTVRVSIGTSSHIRLRLSNAFGRQPLVVGEVTVSCAADNCSGTNAIQPGSTHHATFYGDRGVLIPVGAQMVSDPIDFGFLSPATALSINLFLPNQPQAEAITYHSGSRTTSWFAAGNQVAEQQLSGAGAGQIDHWFYISGIEVLAPRNSGAFLLIGDSITDGRCSTTNGDTRWPDYLFARMRSELSKPSISIINQAAGGNCVLSDGSGGPSVLSRLDRDALSLSGLRLTLVFEGVNDIGIASTEDESQEAVEKQLIAAYVQIATRLAAAGSLVFIATITPFMAPAGETENAETTPYSHPRRELTRQRVNTWIRNHGPEYFKAIVDFDTVLRDKKESSVLAREYDSGDHLHPNEKAFRALANSFPLNLLSI